MEVIILFLIIALITLSCVPTTVEIAEFRRCKGQHEWVNKEVPEVSGSYTVCKKCKLVLGEEEQFEE